jgi:hypothetical protein
METAPAAPATPADAQIAPSSQRRSDRVSLAIALEVVGTDASGHRFTETMRTELVSRYGGSLVSRHPLASETVLQIKHPLSRAETRVRVVGQVGIRDHGHVYGVAFLDPETNFWGIYFPPVAAASDSVARVFLHCCDCQRQEVVTLDPMEFSVFEANREITHYCLQCQIGTRWRTVHSAPGKDAAHSTQKPRMPRTRMRTIACVTQPGGVEDVAQVLDISRGGVCFRSKHQYAVNTWIQLAVPYTPGAANIFVPGRIVWHKETADSQHTYGVQYVKAAGL